MAGVKEVEEKSTKEKIYEAAVRLFAERGFYAVGVRDIAKTAGVNVAMINYHFGGKVGVLKEIINEFFKRFNYAMDKVDSEKTTTVKDLVHIMVRQLVELYRNNTEIGLVVFDALPFNIPEIIDLKMEWAGNNYETLKSFFEKIGIDTDDCTQMGVFSGLLGAIIRLHFKSRYLWEHVVNATPKPKRVEKALEEGCYPEYTDDYYDKFADLLADFYYYGVRGVTKKRKD